MEWLNRLWATAKNAVGIATPQHSEFKADLSLILDAPGTYKDPIEPPFLRHYHKGKKDLYYIASPHASGIETDTFKMIAKAIEEYKPDMVIVECLISSASPQYLQSYIDNAKGQEANGFANVFEAPYAALLAERKHIPFTGGEPTEEAVFAGMKTKGYSTKDMMAFYLLLMIPHWRLLHLPMDEASVDNRAREFLAQYPKLAFIPNEERLTFEEFKAWYDQHNDKPERRYSDLTYNDTGPMNTPDASYFNKLADGISKITNKNIVATIGDAIEKHNKVLVVYGSYHHFIAKPVFEKMFGEKGEIVQLMEQPQINYRDDWSKQPENQPGRASAMTKAGVA